MGVPTVPPERRFAGLGTTFASKAERFSTILKYIVLATALLFILSGCVSEEEKVRRAEAEQVAKALEMLRPPLLGQDPTVCDRGATVRQLPTTRARIGALMDMGFDFDLGCNPERLGRPCRVGIFNETLIGLWHNCPKK